MIKAFVYPQNAFQAQAALNLFEGGGLTRLGFGYAVSELPLGEEGLFNPATNTIILSEETYNDLYADIPRARFTLAHELGHAILHGQYLKQALEGRMPLTYKRAERKPYLDPEWQANCFAGCFLMPENIFRQDVRAGMSDAAITKHFRCSITAVQVRRKKLKL